MDPVQDAAAAAFQALLRGDTAERDRQVARAERIMAAQQAAPRVDLSAAEIVKRLPAEVERQIGRPLTLAERAAVETDPVGCMRRMLAARQST